MLRATVRRVHALGDVSVTIDGMYGSESLIRMPCRFNPAPGDRIFVADVAPSVRVHDWVAWAPLTEIGRVTPPEAHEHPPGQVVGLVDWLKQYETWMGDHQARLDAADQQIAEGKTQIDAARKDLTQAQSDIAAGVREAALERARLDQVETNLEQTARNVTAAGTRIAANEAALTAGQQRLDSAETAVQKAQADLGDGSGLAAKVAGFLTISAMTGVFTKSLTAQDAALLGTTVADTLNVTGMLRGRDAILDGTLDVAQLNVTGGMAAKIILASDVNARRGFFTEGLTAQDAALLGSTVAENLTVTDTLASRVVQAMTAETKKLIVTDDAILNRATVVQSLVTPELIAQKVDARYLRADNIKTGLLEVYGRFRTAPDGQPQIIIQPSQAAWNSKDLAIWFTPDGTTPGGGDAMMYAVTGGMWMNPAGGGGRSESLWTAQQLNLRGQSRAGVRIMDGLTLQATAGTVGPVINSQGGQFLNIIGSAGASLTTLDGPANIRPYGDVNLRSNNGGIYMETTKARGIALTPGDAGVVFLDQSVSPGYNHTASQAANMYIHSSGKIYRSTSSRRYKKYISDYTFDVTRLRDVRLRKWRDRKQAGQDEDLNYYYGAIAEEIYELYPEHVPMIADPTWDGDGPAPMIPDSIAYDRLALSAAVAGWQDTDRRLTEANNHIQSLETRVTQLEGTTHA